MQVVFQRREQLAPGIWQHYFQPAAAVRFEPGQYVDLRLDVAIDDPRGASRTFTLTSLPEDPVISFVTKDQPQVSPYKQALLSLQPGDTGSITDPMGDLILPKLGAQPLVFIASGIGISSYVSMLKRLVKTHETRTIDLHYAVRRPEDAIFSELRDSYTFRTHKLYVKPERLAVSSLLPSAAPGSFWYLSGGQQFVEAALHDLEVSGINRQDIVFDYYDGYVEL